jgi:hypothetical protein
MVAMSSDVKLRRPDATGDRMRAALVATVALVTACVHAPRSPAPFRCRVDRVDVAHWEQVGVREAPVALRVPQGTQRYLGLHSAFYPTGWKLPVAAREDSGSQATVLLADVRRDTVVDRRDATDAIAQWFAPDPTRQCDAFVVRVGGRRMRVTLFETRDSTGVPRSFRSMFAAPYAVDAIMPLVSTGAQVSWLVLAGRSWSRVGQQRLVSALTTMQPDSALAASSHPAAPCPHTLPVRTGDSEVWHHFRNAPFRILQPADVKWGENFRGVENWVRPATDTEQVPPNAYQLDLLATPGWQIAAAGSPPPYYLTCHTAVADRAADIVLDTLGAAGDLGPAHVQTYEAYAYVPIGRDSVMRIRAGIYDDPAPPAQFLRMLSRIEAETPAP